MKKVLLTVIAATLATGTLFASVQTASAQYYDGPYRYERRGPPSPPPYRDPPRKHRHNDTGAVIAGGIAAGLLGGIISGAIANDSGPRYVEPPPPPPPRCWLEDRRVPNSYDGGWHMESFRVCQ